MWGLVVGGLVLLFVACGGAASDVEDPGDSFRKFIQESKGDLCDPSYPDVCIAPPPPELTCDQVPYKNFTVIGADPHGFDADGTGIGCEE